MNKISEIPMVSVIIPCRNEEMFIGQCLESIIRNDYPKDRLEILVVDGMSDDGTRAILESYAQNYSFISLLDNPKKITPAALNTGIRNAKGEVIIRMDAHAKLEKDYISLSVEALDKYGADNVGGNMKTLPQEDGLIGRAIVFSISHRFGVGNSYFRINSTEPRWVDTVFGGCYRRELFDRVGLFNENLPRSQDIEFNLRLKKAGGRTLLVPDIVSYYYPRSNIKSFWKHNVMNGVWAILPFVHSEVIPVRWRHLVPLAFVLGLLSSAALALVSSLGPWPLLGILGAYGVANLVASAHVAQRENDIRFLPLMPAIFSCLHLGYGLGSLLGIFKAIAHMVSKERLAELRTSS